MNSGPQGLPDREKLLEHLRSGGRRPQSLPDLEQQFAIPRERTRDFQRVLKTLEEDGMVRRVKGRKFVAEDENGPAARKRKGNKDGKKEGKAPGRAPVGKELSDIPLDEGASVLFDSEKELGISPPKPQAASASGGSKASGRKDDGLPSRDSGSARPGAASRPGADIGRKHGGGSKFLPRVAKGGFRDKGGRDDRSGSGGRDGGKYGKGGKYDKGGKFGKGGKGFQRDRVTEAGGSEAGGAPGAVSGDKDLIKGKLIRQGGFHFVLPAQAGRGRAFEDNMVLIPRRNLGSARPGDIVSARIVSDEHGEKIGKIIATLEEEISFSEVSKHFFKEHAIPYAYPKSALQEAGEFPEPVFENYPDRKDLRTTHIITIDPSTAKDHDDAISLQRKRDGAGIHRGALRRALDGCADAASDCCSGEA